MVILLRRSALKVEFGAQLVETPEAHRRGCQLSELIRFLVPVSRVDPSTCTLDTQMANKLILITQF